MMPDMVTPTTAPDSARPPTTDASLPDRRTSTTLRRPRGLYETLLAKGSLVVVLLIALLLWGVGAGFTLAWCRSVGLPIDALGLIAWAIPVAITVLEVGLLVARTRIPLAWGFWLGVVALDVFTSAAGLLLAVTPRLWADLRLSASDPTAWAIAAILGLLIAVVPEPTVRLVWKELWR